MFGASPARAAGRKGRRGRTRWARRCPASPPRLGGLEGMGEGQGTKRDPAGGQPQPGGWGRRGHGERAEGAGALVGRPQGSAQVLAPRAPQAGSALSSVGRSVQDWSPGERLPSGTLRRLLLGREAKGNTLQNGFISGWKPHYPLSVKTDKGHGKCWPV